VHFGGGINATCNKHLRDGTVSESCAKCYIMSWDLLISLNKYKSLFHYFLLNLSLLFPMGESVSLCVCARQCRVGWGGGWW